MIFPPFIKLENLNGLFSGKGHYLTNISNTQHWKISTIRVISVGADVEEMRHKSFRDVVVTDFPTALSVPADLKKPIIAAVNGYAVCRFKLDSNKLPNLNNSLPF